jgi:glycosyltransferase involved in cell wall biosynthesis
MEIRREDHATLEAVRKACYDRSRSMPSASPRVSVVTLTYNHAAVLPRCLESLLGQTFGDWEQVLLDDGSTDGTPDVAARLADPRIRVLRQEHRGIDALPRTYREAVARCRAPLVAFLDGDDSWPTDRLEALVPAFEDPGVVLAYGRTQVVADPDSGCAPTVPTPLFFEVHGHDVMFNTPVGRAALAMLDCRFFNFTHMIAALIRREALDRIEGPRTFPGMPVMDYSTLLYLCLEGRFHFEDRVTGFWRVRADSVSVVQRARVLWGAYRQARDFRLRFGARLGFSAAEWARIDRHWRERLPRMMLQEGRNLLKRRQWAEARRALRHAFGGRRWRDGLDASLGIAGSFVGRDLEWRYRAARWVRPRAYQP